MTYKLSPSHHSQATKLKEKYYFFMLFSFVITSLIKVITAFILTKGINFYHRALSIFCTNLVFILKVYLIPLLMIYLIALRLVFFLQTNRPVNTNNLKYLIALQLIFSGVTAIFTIWFPFEVIFTVIIITQMILFVPFFITQKLKTVENDEQLSICDISFLKDTRKQCMIFLFVLAPFLVFYCILTLAWSSIFLILSKHIIAIIIHKGNLIFNIFMVFGSIMALLWYLMSSLIFINLARNLFFIIGIEVRNKKTDGMINLLKFIYQNLGKVSFAALIKINIFLWRRFIKENNNDNIYEDGVFNEPIISKIVKWILQSKIGFLTDNVDLDLSYSVINNISLFKGFKKITTKIKNRELPSDIYKRSSVNCSLLLRNYFFVYFIAVLLFCATNLRSILLISKEYEIGTFKNIGLDVVYNVYFNVTFIVSISALIAYTLLDSISNQMKGLHYKIKINSLI